MSVYLLVPQPDPAIDPALELRLQRSLPDTLRLEREIPGGGMARVFLAEDLGLRRKVVVKVLSPDLAEGLSHERFRRETHLAAQLQHPHLVPVLQAGNADGLPYFVMPYVAGEALRSRLRDGEPLPPREAVAVLRDVARAMAYAHAEGVVHRDIKPDNVLISRGSAMVSDFGIAKALSSARSLGDDDAALTRAGSSLGTPTYMAPEQAAADPAADHRVDIYAFGIMAYELLNGRPPFHAVSPQALLTAHLVEKPVAIDQRVAGLPRGLVELVMQCLEKDPARRPAAAQELVDRLENVDWSGERPAAIGQRVARRWWPVAAAAIALFAVGAWWWRGREALPPRNPALVAVVPFRVASVDPALHYLRDGMLDLLAAKLPGQGGLQATEPRQLLDAWRAAGGTAASDLSTRDAHRLARKLGSGWLLLGDVVGTPVRIVLNAALFPVDGTTPATRLSLEGPPDSLGALVDGMVEKLLTSVSSDPVGASSLGRTSLPALRAYLDGVAKLRSGQPAAVRAFTEAVEIDSTFAPAALGLMQAAGWWNDGGASAKAARLAWAGRDQLNARDRALLEASLGPAYPRRPSAREEFDAAERYLRLAPERADAWHIVGDKIYHFGNALGIPDRATRSADYFRRALALDSTYVPGYIHLQQLAVELGDSALDTRLERLRAAADSDAYWRLPHEWYRAAASGDSAGVARAWAARPARDNGLLWTIQRTPLNAAGTDPVEALRAVDTLIATASPSNVLALNRTAWAMALLLGRPAAARAFLDKGLAPGSEGHAARLIHDAMLEAGDTAAARNAAQQLVPVATSPASRDTMVRWRQQVAARALLYWRLSHGDTTASSLLLQRAAMTPGNGDLADRELDAITVATLEAMHADVLRRSDAPRLADRLDSLMATTNYQGSATRLGMGALITASLLEKYHGPERALAAARRRANWWNNDAPYLAAQLREQGRLAALAGRRDEAVVAYRHYLSLRRSPEPAVQPEVDNVRKELARLEQR